MNKPYIPLTTPQTISELESTMKPQAMKPEEDDLADKEEVKMSKPEKNKKKTSNAKKAPIFSEDGIQF